MPKKNLENIIQLGPTLIFSFSRFFPAQKAGGNLLEFISDSWRSLRLHGLRIVFTEKLFRNYYRQTPKTWEVNFFLTRVFCGMISTAAHHIFRMLGLSEHRHGANKCSRWWGAWVPKKWTKHDICSYWNK